MPMGSLRVRADSGQLLTILALLAMGGPVLSDLYLASLPGIAVAFGVSATSVQLTLTAALAGVAVGQAVLGPLSDALGRRLPLVLGLGAAFAGSVAAALAPDLGALIAARFVQGFGVAAGLVLSRAIVADVVGGARRTGWLSIISVAAGVAACAAPIVGGVLSTAVGWRGPMWAVAGFLAVAFVAALLLVPETRNRSQGTTGREREVESAGVRSVPFLSYALCLGFAFAAYMAFVAASPFLYQEVIGWTSLEYGFVYAGHALLMAAASLIAGRLVGRITERVLLTVGIGCLVAAGCGSLAVAVLGGWVGLFPPCLALVSIGMGTTFPTTMGLALGHARHSAGLGSAILGCVQFGVAAAVAPLLGLGANAQISFAVVLLAAALLAAVALTSGVRAEVRLAAPLRSAAEVGPPARQAV